MRILHTMIRVGDLDRSIRFYTEALGMKLLRRKDYPGGEFTLAFLGYGEEASGAVVELTYNWGRSAYDLARISHRLSAASAETPAIAAFLPAAPPAACLQHASAAPG